MASAASAELRPSSWLNYFFLYDGSKVKGESDRTRAGINYFHPPQTIIDQQELLCGQIAGVVRCMTEITNSPPRLMRLRKLKFAIQVHGDYLWALGCSVDISDISCKRYLEDLIGLFRFYNGPLWRAYRIYPHSDLSEEWNIYIDHIQSNTTDLHRIFNSLIHVDKTKVDPLLLLKATLILQTCQRFPHVLAGCILYKNRIVSTQLPPTLTSKILIQRIGYVRRPPSVASFQSSDPVLPDNVCMLPVYIMEKEAVALRQYPTQWMTRLPTSSRKTSSASHCLSEEGHNNQSNGSDDMALEKERGKVASQKSEFSAEPALACVTRQELDTGGVPLEESLVGPLPDTPLRSSSLNALSKCDPADEVDQVTLTEDSPPKVFPDDTSDNLLLQALEQNEGLPITESDYEIRSERQSTGSFVTCDSTTELKKGSQGSLCSSMDISEDSYHQFAAMCPDISYTITPEKQLECDYNTRFKDNISDLTDATDAESESNEKDTRTSELIPPSSESTNVNLTAKASSITDWTLTLDPSPSASSAKLVQMVLYVHNIKGLVLSLMAEWPFKYNKESIQDVYDSTLASLNGLEVHLKETMPAENNNVAKTAYSFTHYDSIQNILTDNLPSVSNTHDRLFLRAATLIHSDFSCHQSLQEMTVRNASSALYACQSVVHQTYFQQLGPPFRNSGIPDPQDTAFLLPGRAKQKLLKHGFNLL
ncbi:BLOC-3 complex member HPS4 [Spea bombifrons]|uniref:BLOC-3 complex member HPS4 n=1 Tax=Spea bombifrons TaxID=233779 RepID=UPI0023491B3A|nr:BLOC-3 complex member HPS4 [Spea bombifrons]